MWKKTDEVQERERFIRDWLSGDWTMETLVGRYGISEKTGWKTVRRFAEEGKPGLRNRSRAPKKQAGQTTPDVEVAIVRVRQRFPKWGAVTIRAKLVLESGHNRWPALSTIGEVLKRHGLVTPRRRRTKTPPYSAPLAHAEEPNDVWCIDFKGWFLTRDGLRCEPLTVTDAHSRYLMVCRAMRGINGLEVRHWLTEAFKRYGLPKAIRSDNGTPFASRGLGGLSALSCWWIRLGITPERIAPGRPDQNGRHERFHKTLKEQCENLPAGNRTAQQRAFNRFQTIYNEERPHAALGGVYPASVYHRSPRRMPASLPDTAYSEGVELRRVRSNGDIKWRGELVFVSEALVGQTIALQQENSRYWTIFFGSLVLGTLDTSIPRVSRC
jgi:transposase InsO family protein